MRRLLAVLTATVLLVAGAVGAARPPAARATTVPARQVAYDWAVTQAHGAWYCWGGTGPCYDCSGLVYEAYRHAGWTVPRTTYGLLAWWRVYAIPWWQARRGDLAFFGTGHVEFFDWGHWTYGALESGTRVGWHYWWSGSWWQPTGYYRIWGTG